MENTQRQRPMHEIAKEIRSNWKNIYFGAVPYVKAMEQLNSIEDDYYADSARSIVQYFLGNAMTWRGEVAKRVKKELNEILKNK